MIRAEILHSLLLSVSTYAPQWLVWSFCWCVVSASCFVTAFFFVFSLPYLQEHGCVEIQKYCYHGNSTQRLILSGDFKCKWIRSWLICQPRGILTNRKCLPWSWVIAKVLAQNVNLTSKKRSVLFGNLTKRSIWRLGVAEEGTWNVLNSPYENTKQFSKHEKLIGRPPVFSMHSISLTKFFVCFGLNELFEFS